MAKKRGRPTKYKPEYDDLAFKYCLLGATDEDLAQFFDVHVSSINEWKKHFPSFYESIQRGKVEADARVAEALYKKATGYEQEDTYFSNYQGEVTATPYIKKVGPDTAAAFIWLKNRQPHKWRDKQELEHSGKDGGPIEISDAREALLKKLAERG